MEFKKKIVFGIGFFIILFGIGFLFIGETKMTQQLLPQNLKNFMLPSSINSSDNRTIGYEYLDSDVIHIWNTQDDYFINQTSGIQLTNHHQEYWSKNQWCVYINWGTWRKACFNEFDLTWNLNTDNSTYVNLTGSTTISEGPYEADLTIEYYLNLNSKDIKITPTIFNKKKDFEGYFIWRIEDIQISMTEENDILKFNETDYWLNNSINMSLNNLPQKKFKIWDDKEFLSLEWVESNYTLNVSSEEGQYNSPIELWLGPFNIPKDTSYNTTFYWIDAIAVDDISDGTASGTTTLTVEHITTGTGTNGILIVTVQVTDASETDRIIQSVTYGGFNKPLTHLAIDSDDAIEQRTEIWYLANPPEQTANIIVTGDGSMTDLSLGAISLTGVDVSNLIGGDVYYFDGSDESANDPDGVWTDETNVDDGDNSTSAFTNTGGTSSSNELTIGGTNAPSTGDSIDLVWLRIFGGGGNNPTEDLITEVYTDGGQPSGELLGNFITFKTSAGVGFYYHELPTPTGGWTWAKLQALETVTYCGGNVDTTSCIVYKVEIIVNPTIIFANTSGIGNPTLDITTVGTSSYVIDSLAQAEADGTKIANATGPAIHKTDVGGDTHASQYVDAGGAGPQTMSYSDTDADKQWVMSAVSIPIVSAGGDTCTCAGLDTNWEIDHSDACTITGDCNLGTGTLSFTGTGTTICQANVNTSDLGDPTSTGTFQIDSSCLVLVS